MCAGRSEAYIAPLGQTVKRKYPIFMTCETLTIPPEMIAGRRGSLWKTSLKTSGEEVTRPAYYCNIETILAELVIVNPESAP
jgi:hypothetical protein